MSLLDQSPWWLIPYALLLLWMVYSMMEFSVSLMADHARKGKKPVSAQELKQRLLRLNEADQPLQLAEGVDCDLEISWEEEAPVPAGRFLVASRGRSGKVRFLLDELRHEMRMNQVDRSHGLVIGWAGWLPRLDFFFGTQAGPPDIGLTGRVGQTALQAGWIMRPVIWWFQATHSGVTPVPFRRIPTRLFWGILYPMSYALAMGYFTWVAWPIGSSDVLIMVGVSAGWWGIWGLLLWMLLGFPRFWRGKRH